GIAQVDTVIVDRPAEPGVPGRRAHRASGKRELHRSEYAALGAREGAIVVAALEVGEIEIVHFGLRVSPGEADPNRIEIERAADESAIGPVVASCDRGEPAEHPLDRREARLGVVAAVDVKR